jgi:hypothetical protein
MIRTISNDQADRQKQHLHGFFSDGIQGVAQDALEGGPSFLDRGDDAGKSRLGQHHPGGRFGNVGGGRDGDPHLSLAQRRGIVGTIAAHTDGVAAFLKRLDQLVLVLRQHAGEDRELFGMDCVGNRPQRTYGAIKPYRLRDDGRRRRRIAGHHDGADAQAV